MTKRPFSKFASAVETSFRAMIEDVSKHPPRNPIKAAIYRHFPSTQRMLGHPGPLGYLWLNADIAADARAEGTVLNSPPKEITKFQYDDWDCPCEGARIIGWTEEKMGIQIDAMFDNWLKETRRRDAGDATVLLFCHEFARRAVGFEGSPLPGVGTLPPGAEWSAFMDRPDAEAFAAHAGFLIQRLEPRRDEVDVTFEGARICGRLEASMGQKMTDIAEAVTSRCAAGPDAGKTRDQIFAGFSKAVAAEVYGGLRSPWFDGREDVRPAVMPQRDRFEAPAAEQLSPC